MDRLAKELFFSLANSSIKKQRSQRKGYGFTESPNG